MKHRSIRLSLLAAFIALIVTSSPSVAGVWVGQDNGRDLNGGGWIGNDNWDNVTGTYAPDNVWEDTYLSEWSEPGHDWMRDRFLKWGAAAEQKLNNESATKGLDTEMRIHDQFYYNFVDAWNSNLPFSKGPENENPAEELFQGYTEVDAEIQEPKLIDVNFNYFWDIKIDSEKAPLVGHPDFYTEIEYCDNNFNNCNHDVMGWFEKKVRVQ